MDLAKDCVRTCRVVKTVAERTGVDSSGVDLGMKQVENLGRCVDLA